MVLLGRRRKGDDGGLDFVQIRPALRLAIRKVVNDEGAPLDKTARKALLKALKDDDVLEAAVAMADTTDVEAVEGRDWATFFDALTKFIMAIAPLIIEILTKMGGMPV